MSEWTSISVVSASTYKFVHYSFALVCFVLPSLLNIEATRLFSTTGMYKEVNILVNIHVSHWNIQRVKLMCQVLLYPCLKKVNLGIFFFTLTWV